MATQDDLDNALEWARAQVGKSYVLGSFGSTFDCSTYMSGIATMIRDGHASRWFTTHPFHGGGHSPLAGWERNLDAPFQIGITGSGIGHTGGTLLGVDFEATAAGSRIVRSEEMDGRTRGAHDSYYQYVYGFRPSLLEDGGGSSSRFPFNVDSTEPSARPLQKELKRTGFLDPEDPERDFYGWRTKDAVAEFHLEHPQFKWDGIDYDPQIGPQGWEFLQGLPSVAVEYDVSFVVLAPRENVLDAMARFWPDPGEGDVLELVTDYNRARDVFLAPGQEIDVAGNAYETEDGDSVLSVAKVEDASVEDLFDTNDMTAVDLAGGYTLSWKGEEPGSDPSPYLEGLPKLGGSEPSARHLIAELKRVNYLPRGFADRDEYDEFVGEAVRRFHRCNPFLHEEVAEDPDQITVAGLVELGKEPDEGYDPDHEVDIPEPPGPDREPVTYVTQGDSIRSLIDAHGAFEDLDSWNDPIELKDGQQLVVGWRDVEPPEPEPEPDPYEDGLPQTGSQSPDSRDLQRELVRVGYMPQDVELHPNYGPQTQSATLKFHSANPDLDRTGSAQIGRDGWEHLRGEGDGEYEAPPASDTPGELDDSQITMSQMGEHPSGEAACREYAREACRIIGLGEDHWVTGMTTIAGRETAFNHPNWQVNTNDSNARNVGELFGGGPGPDGNPGMCSRGAWQTIPQTFAQYHQAGTSVDIYNPVASCAAAINYIMGRYGVARDGHDLTDKVQQADPNQPPRGY